MADKKTAKKATSKASNKKERDRARRFVDGPGEDNLGPVPKG